MSNRSSGMDFFDWLILSIIVLGLLGYGPCASCLHDCGPTLKAVSDGPTLKAVSDGGLKDNSTKRPGSAR